METFVFSKTMNNQTQRFPTLVVAAFISSVALVAVPARAQAQESSGPDRVVVTLSDPSRPALVKASLIAGGITVKAYDGKDVIVEARARNREDSDEDRPGPKRLVIGTTGLNVEEENNQVNIGTESCQRAI